MKHTLVFTIDDFSKAEAIEATIDPSKERQVPTSVVIIGDLSKLTVGLAVKMRQDRALRELVINACDILLKWEKQMEGN